MKYSTAQPNIDHYVKIDSFNDLWKAVESDHWLINAPAASAEQTFAGCFIGSMQRSSHVCHETILMQRDGYGLELFARWKMSVVDPLFGVELRICSHSARTLEAHLSGATVAPPVKIKSKDVGTNSIYKIVEVTARLARR